MMRLIDLFRHNALKKIIALVAAFCMWLFVMMEQDPEIEDTYTVPLTMSKTLKRVRSTRARRVPTL